MGMLKGLMRIVVMVGCCSLLGSVLNPCLAAEDSPWMFRARILGVFPDDSSSPITLIGGEANVDGAYTPDLDVSYFFTDNIAAELVFLAYARHDVKAKNTAVGDIDLGSLDLVPPTLTIQYHFTPENNFRPYVGAGLSYVLIPNEDPGDATDIRYDDGVIGSTLQAGFDYFYNKHWCLNFDIKKVWVNVDVEVDALDTTVKTSVDVDPWLFGIGVGYHF